MSSIRKIERAEQAAYRAMVKAQSELVAARTTRQGLEMLGHRAAADMVINEDQLAKLSRRAGAYRAQWDAASRRLEEALTRLDREVI